MKLQMQAIQFKADEQLLELIQKKVDKLETFYDNFIDGEVTLKVEKDEVRENKSLQIKLNYKGGNLFAKENAKTFEVGLDKAVEGLRRQVRKLKDKQN